ncbi:MAG TPA: FAD-dependent thymidylate synthase [Phycisphaerales bacterium]|nr:FAD-dependent thymidylate synthase [Phycisphaerales bacterium]
MPHPAQPSTHTPPTTTTAAPTASLEAKPTAFPSAAKVVQPERPHRDVMGGAARVEIKCLDHGFVALIDAMPRLVAEGQTADSAIVQAARVSYGQGTKQVNEDRGLIRYLLRHRHTTPFEMVEFKFHIAMPIFIARQWIRHRTANVNEYSARYSILPDRFYTPSLDAVRKQSKGNRQGGEETFVVGHGGTADAPHDELRTAQEFLDFLDVSQQQYEKYLKLTEKGVSRELARMGLPVNVYTEWYWKCDLHNILRFLSLRMDAHAQLEIREFATAMHDLVAPIVPITMEAWRDYELESVHLTRLEVESLRNSRGSKPGPIATDNKREQAEWETKRRNLGLD